MANPQATGTLGSMAFSWALSATAAIPNGPIINLPHGGANVAQPTSSFTSPLPKRGEPVMTETYSKHEVDSKLETAAAKTDTKFADMLGEMRLANRDLGGKIDVLKSEIEGKIGTLQARVDMLPGRLTIIGTILGTALGVGGLLFAALQYGGATYGNGLTAHQMVQDTVAQTLKELKK